LYARASCTYRCAGGSERSIVYTGGDEDEVDGLLVPSV
jgi:hypothetical protein